MDVQGRRFHVAGSAAPDTAVDLLRDARGLIATIARKLAARGGTCLLCVGREPRAAGAADAPSVTFDWTALETLGALLEADAVPANGEQSRLLTVVASTKTEEHVPQHRRALWEQLKQAEAAQLEFIDAGWTSTETENRLSEGRRTVWSSPAFGTPAGRPCGRSKTKTLWSGTRIGVLRRVVERVARPRRYGGPVARRSLVGRWSVAPERDGRERRSLLARRSTVRTTVRSR